MMGPGAATRGPAGSFLETLGRIRATLGHVRRFIQRQWTLKGTLLQSAREVHARTGKSVAQQLGEIARLRRGPGNLRAIDYYLYGVYDDDRFTPGAKREVLSWHPSRLATALNDGHWAGICHDKLLFYGLLQGLGLPFPAVYAAYAAGRSFGRTPVLASPTAMAEFLRHGMVYPFFGKPVHGAYGKGASAVASFSPAHDRLIFGTGGGIGVDEYVRDYVVGGKRGYLFQEPLRQHPDLDRISGGRVGTLRMIVLRGDDGPRLFRVIWRIPVGANITDNFLHGSRGNLVAHVDREGGQVGKVVQAINYAKPARDSHSRLGRELEVHPDTGERITGIILPGWDGIVSTCLEAAAALPGLRYQSWDVAIGPEGPLLLELNFRGGIDITQIPGTAGFHDTEFQEFWTRYARGK